MRKPEDNYSPKSAWTSRRVIQRASQAVAIIGSISVAYATVTTSYLSDASNGQVVVVPAPTESQFGSSASAARAQPAAAATADTAVFAANQPQAQIGLSPANVVAIAQPGHYFSDPFWVEGHIAQTNKVYISGTEDTYLVCNNTLSQTCENTPRMPVTVDTGTGDDGNSPPTAGSLAAQAANNGVKFQVAGVHPFRNAAGTWTMALTLHVQITGNACTGLQCGWSVIANATPQVGSNTDDPPTKWRATNALLIGSFNPNQAASANYDGKYYQDDDAGQTLYLIYQKRLNGEVNNHARNGIVAQKMVSFTTLESEGPVTILAPDDGVPKASELYSEGRQDDLKLVETGNITKIAGKYVMAYAVGGFKTDSYKIGLAYSDSLLPSNGYRKITADDTNHVWAPNDTKEILYFVQSQVKGWYNWFKPKVRAPGVPTIAKIGPSGSWVVMFAGYDPSEPQDGDGTYSPAHRRPYFIKVDVSGLMNNTKSVNAVDETTLAGFITLASS